MVSEYHKKYIQQPDDKILRKIEAKKQELIAIKRAGIEPSGDSSRLDVCALGCGDVRLIEGHRTIFSDVFDKKAEVITLDLTIDHLTGEHGVIQHDVSTPLPGGPYDVTYGHVVLKFIETPKQWDAIINSFNALKPGGIAIHILNEQDYSDLAKTLADGYFPVDIDEIRERLDSLRIHHRTVDVEYGLALVIISE